MDKTTSTCSVSRRSKGADLCYSPDFISSPYDFNSIEINCSPVLPIIGKQDSSELNNNRFQIHLINDDTIESLSLKSPSPQLERHQFSLQFFPTTSCFNLIKCQSPTQEDLPVRSNRLLKVRKHTDLTSYPLPSLLLHQLGEATSEAPASYKRKKSS
jgi:hypothetical protein